MDEKKKIKHRHKHSPVKEKNLLLTTFLNLVITIAEIAGGILSNSLALLSDALHNLSDTFSTFIAYVATKISKKDASTSNTYGYKRVEILAAMLNAVILVITCIFLFREAWERIQDPQPVNSLIVIFIAMIGLAANVLGVTLLRKDSKKSLNVKAAYVHLIGDSLSSVVVILAALSMQFFQIYLIDPVVTIIIGIYLLRESYIILKESVNILMQSSPENLDLKRLQEKIEALPEISSIHHVHAWNLNDRQIHLEAHVELQNDLKTSDLNPVRSEIEKILKKKFNIQHTTLQFEYDSKHVKTLISKNG